MSIDDEIKEMQRNAMKELWRKSKAEADKAVLEVEMMKYHIAKEGIVLGDVT